MLSKLAMLCQSVCIFLIGLPFAAAQIEPDSAQVLLYFPQLADGGSRAQQWQTTFVFVNPSRTSTAAVQLNIYDNNGNPLTLDLGSGPTSVLNFSIPPQGSRQFRSKMASLQTVTGWAKAASTIPVQATVLFATFVNGTVQYQVSAPSTLPAGRFWSPANPNLGIALANAYTGVPVTVTVSAFDSDGHAVGANTLTLARNAHTSFNLFQVMSLPASFVGSIVITPQVPNQNFLAWTLNSDSGAISSLPSGGSRWPISHWERIWLVYSKVVDAATQLSGMLGTNLSSPVPTLNISPDPVINAFATPSGTVQINLALSELISDSESELAFAIAHELGHIIQFRTGNLLFNANREFDADEYGMLFSLGAGYDPYAAAGALAKLDMARGQAGLMAQLFDNFSGDLHGSFNSRIDAVFNTLETLCSSPELANSCAQYKSVVHPHFPGNAPLSVPVTPVPVK